ncbi:uncharacterized protein LOC142974685 [Anticarsia gemmatalis]|uniref:uncharacterized protein LOC142974685 n=1 Tax=Anticarsia gemmatalis TaxID=129554 RepID=UPI003F75F4AF
MARWGDEKTLYFILLYRNQECLWNSRSPFYKNKKAREDAYHSILETFNDNQLDLKCIKTKIKNLRSVYHTELKKVKDSRNAGGDGPVYKPSLAWFEEMHSFLGAEVDSQSAESQENLTSEIETLGEIHCEIPTQHSASEQISVEVSLNSDIKEEVTESSDIDQATANDTHSYPITLTPDPLAGAATETLRYTERRKDQKRSNPRKRPHEDTDIPKNVLDRLISTLSCLKPSHLTTVDINDQTHLFCLYVSAQLKKLPEHVSVELQLQIQNLLTEARLKWLTRSHNTSSSECTVVKEERISEDGRPEPE